MDYFRNETRPTTTRTVGHQQILEYGITEKKEIQKRVWEGEGKGFACLGKIHE